MHFREMINKSILTILPFGILAVFLLNWILNIENPVIRLCGIFVTVAGYSALFIFIEYLVQKQSDRSIFETGERPLNSINEEAEAGDLGELSPIEEDTDFGELIEVDAQDQQPVELINPVQKTKSESKNLVTESDLQEKIEELEVLDESVEDLEVIDD